LPRLSSKCAFLGTLEGGRKRGYGFRRQPREAAQYRGLLAILAYVSIFPTSNSECSIT
jgi:hypothetical protein